MFKDATVLVTGAGGFIGSHLLAALKLQGAQIIAIDRVAREGMQATNVRILSEVRQAFEWSQQLYGKPVEYVFHLAGQKSAGLAKQDPYETLQLAFQSTLNILEVARVQPELKKVVLISSLSVYGQKEDHQKNLLQESDLPIADSVYSSTKIIGEDLGLSYWNDFGVPVSIARLANVYGPHQTNLAIIPSLISQMLQSQDLALGNVDSIRDFIYVDDVVRGLLELGVNAKTSGQIFNIATGVGTSIQGIVDILSGILSFSGRTRVDQSKVRLNEKSFVVGDIGALQKVSSWSPQMTLQAGLVEVVKAIKGDDGIRK